MNASWSYCLVLDSTYEPLSLIIIFGKIFMNFSSLFRLKSTTLKKITEFSIAFEMSEKEGVSIRPILGPTYTSFQHQLLILTPMRGGVGGEVKSKVKKNIWSGCENFFQWVKIIIQSWSKISCKKVISIMLLERFQVISCFWEVFYMR